MSEITITWEAHDGYVGGSAPQHLVIHTEDFQGLDPTEAEDLLSELVENDFADKVTWGINNGMESEVARILKAVEDLEAANNRGSTS